MNSNTPISERFIYEERRLGAHNQKKEHVGSIMKCNILESERDFVILRM